MRLVDNSDSSNWTIQFRLSPPFPAGRVFFAIFFMFFCSFFNAATTNYRRTGKTAARLIVREGVLQAARPERSCCSSVRRLLGMYEESETLSTFCTPAPTSSSFVSPYGPEFSPNHFLKFIYHNLYFRQTHCVKAYYMLYCMWESQNSRRLPSPEDFI